jgi:hypothetical protein
MHMDASGWGRRPVVMGLFLVLLSLSIHLAPMLNSTLSMSNEHWNARGELVANDFMAYTIDLHAHGEVAFARRPLTTALIRSFMALGLPAAWAFILPQYLLWLLVGLMVRHLATPFGAAAAMGAQVFFHLLPTVLFAFSRPSTRMMSHCNTFSFSWPYALSCAPSGCGSPVG